MLLKLSLKWQYGGADSTSTKSHWDEDMVASLQLHTVDWEWVPWLLSLTFHLWREIFFFIPRPYLGLTESYCKDSLSMDSMPSWVTNLFSSVQFSHQSCHCYANLLHHFKQFSSHRQLVCIQTLAKQGASLVAQAIKNPPALWENQVWSLSWEDSLKKGMTTHSGILAWRIPWTEEPGGLQSMGSQRVRHDWATKEHQSSNTEIQI